MKGDASSSPGRPVPLPVEGGRPALIVDGLACSDEWDTLALARLPTSGLLRKAMWWRRA
jgi:hypothetical protein